jgi:hypothetical protein
MSEAKRIGELLPRILARTERMMAFQTILNLFPCRMRRKTIIMTLREMGNLSADETEMLLSANMLEDA